MKELIVCMFSTGYPYEGINSVHVFYRISV